MSEWRNTTLGAVVDVRVSNVDKKTLPGERSVRLCNYMDVYSANAIKPERSLMLASVTDAEYQRFKLQAGDVVITKDSESPDDIAVSTYIAPGVGDDVVCGYHLAMLRPKPGIDGHFLSHLLRLPQVNLHFAKSATGSTRYGLGLKSIHDAPLRIPADESEQRGIAEVLTALDEQIEQTELEKAKLARVITGAFDDVFGAGLVGDTSLANIKNGALLSGWTRVTVSQAAPEIVDFRGRTPLKLGMRWGGGDIQALSANNVEMGRINLEKETYFASDALYERWMTKGACAKDDIVMTLEAPLGNIALVPDDRKYILSQRVVLLKPNKAILPGRYLYLYLRWRWFQQLLVEESTGTTATGIQRKKLEKLPVLVAPQKELESITNFLLSLLVQMDDFDAELKKLRLQKKGLMYDLLTGATRVR